MATSTSASTDKGTASEPTESSLGSLGRKWWTGDLNFEFVAHRKRWYIISAVLIAICVIALLTRGLNLGIEFTGGATFTAPAQTAEAALPQVEDAVRNSGVPDMSDVSVQGTGDMVRVQTRTLAAEETPIIRNAIAQALQVPPDQVAASIIGASWGDQVTKQAAIALVVFLALVMVMIGVYFRDWKYSVAAIVALLHDLILTVGVYAIVGFTVTPATVTAVLTILGYSLYDTVVVFDKLRENTREMPNKTYAEAANSAINQVLIRSLNTTVIGVLPVVALLFTGTVLLGSGPLQDVGLALLIGMLTGAYSSIFIATPLLVDLKSREPDLVKHDQDVIQKRERAESKSSAKKSGPPMKSAGDVTKTAAPDTDSPDPDRTATTGSATTSVVTVSRTDAENMRNRAAGRPQPSKTSRSERKSR